MKIERYKRQLDISYSLGAEATIELLRKQSARVRAVFIHPDFREGEGRRLIESLCADAGIYIEVGEKPFNILTQKENCFVIGAFEKYACSLKTDVDHIVLVNPSNSGNVGTIIRTAVGFGVPDIAVITPAADLFDPKTIRASIGAIFSLRFEEYASFDEYLSRHSPRAVYPFMLHAKHTLPQTAFVHPSALVFGNEATGLPDSYSAYETVVIPHTDAIDSLNLPIAASIAIYELTKAK